MENGTTVRRIGNGISTNTSVATAMILLVTGVALAPVANAVPSFASQTGMPCARCHTIGYGPALTPYGRQFKLNGFTFGDGKPLPVALMLQGGYTRTSGDLPEAPADHTSVNDNLSLDQVSVFFAGRIGEHSGGFVQITYSGPDRATSWDNIDLRYARALSFGDNAAVVGVTLNNGPAVQDLWNSTPAWGYPYIGSALAPTPAAGPLLAGLGQSVLGATAYAMFNDHWYVEAGAYKGVSNRWLKNFGLDVGASANLEGMAPYARLAYQYDGPVQHGSIGLLALGARVAPDPTISARDHFSDLTVDATWQYLPEGRHQLSMNASVTHEHRRLDATYVDEGAESPSQNLTFTSIDATYAYDRTWSLAASLFDSRGTRDALLYAPAPLDGSLGGSPDSRGYTLQLEYIPFGKQNSVWRPFLNVRTGLQYTGYTKFNGGSSNYDGYGRSASANNTLFAYLWIIL